jgi:ankyrin repeat protein
VIARSGKSSKLANAVDPSSRDTALHFACEGHNYELVTRLLGHGARVNVKGAHAEVPLHRAVRDRRNAPMVRSLFKHDCEPDMPNDQGSTPMHIAAERGNLEIMEALVDNGASVDMQDSDGNTALHVASKNQKSKATALLLSKGCDPSIRNRAGLTPFQLSKKGKVRIAYSAFGIDA